MKSTTLYINALLLSIGLFVAHFALTPTTSSAVVVDRVVALVNEDIITLSELKAASAAAEGLLKEAGGLPKDFSSKRSMILDGMIEKMLMKQSAEKAGIDVSDREVEKAIEGIREKNGLDEDDLLLLLAQSGLTYDDYKEQMRDEIRQSKFINQVLSRNILLDAEDVEECYLRHREQFTAPPAYHLQLIYISSDEKATMEKKIAAIEEGLKKGTDFGKLASTYSDGPGISNGGDIGFLRADELSPEIKSSATMLSPGEVAGPIVTDRGTSFIKLLDIREAGYMPLEEVREEVRQILYNEVLEENYNHWLEETKNEAHIEVRL